MNTLMKIRALFGVAAAYDAILGAAFLFAAATLFAKFDVPPPNHPGYVQFPALLLIIFGLMYAAIAKDPIKNKNLIIYGILLKISYCGVISYHWATSDLPNLWKPFCIIDGVFLILFFLAWKSLKEPSEES